VQHYPAVLKVPNRHVSVIGCTDTVCMYIVLVLWLYRTVSYGILQSGDSRGVLQRITAPKTRSLGALKPLSLLSTCDVISGYGDSAALRRSLVGAAQKCDIKFDDFFWLSCDYSAWNLKTGD
jgi:hypothetical protein